MGASELLSCWAAIAVPAGIKLSRHRRDVPSLTAAGMLEAEQQFRRVVGYQDLAKLATAVERELTLPRPNSAWTEEAAIVAAT